MRAAAGGPPGGGRGLCPEDTNPARAAHRPATWSSSPSIPCAPTASAPTATRRRDAEPRSSRARGRDGRARLGARAADASLAHLALHGTLSGRARHPRQRLAAARPNVPVLAEILQQRGFRTGAFVSSVVLSRQSGLAAASHITPIGSRSAKTMRGS